MNKGLFGIVAAVIVVLFGLIVLGGDSTEDVTGPGTSNTAGTGSVVLTEFGDLQCPACRAQYPIVDRLKEFYGDRITVQFVHLPLVSIHPNAFAAARASEAAANQGQFFPMHDILYENQNAWANVGQNDAISFFEGYATQLGLDIEQYNTDFRSSEINDRIQQDLAWADEKGYTSTPTFEINGEQIESPNPNNPDQAFAQFQALIDPLLGDETATEEPAPATTDESATE